MRVFISITASTYEKRNWHHLLLYIMKHMRFHGAPSLELDMQILILDEKWFYEAVRDISFVFYLNILGKTISKMKWRNYLAINANDKRRRIFVWHFWTILDALKLIYANVSVAFPLLVCILHYNVYLFTHELVQHIFAKYLLWTWNGNCTKNTFKLLNSFFRKFYKL